MPIIQQSYEPLKARKNPYSYWSRGDDPYLAAWRSAMNEEKRFSLEAEDKKKKRREKK